MSSVSPGRSAIPKKTAAKNSVVGVQRRNTFGYGDSKAPPPDGKTTPVTTSSTKPSPVSAAPASTNAEMRRSVSLILFQLSSVLNDAICFQLLRIPNLPCVSVIAFSALYYVFIM